MQPRPRKLPLLRLLPDRVLQTHGPRAGDTLYLSFDDGPHPEHTPAVLDVLRRHGARASFFLIGDRVVEHPDLVRRIADEGHLLGNHSYSHPLFHRLSLRDQLDEIDRADDALAAIDGRPRHRFRPPRGVLSLPLLMHFARRRRSIAYWSYDSLDYQGTAPERVIDMLRRTPPAAGDVLLMHDDSGIAVRVLETMLPEWRDRGARLAPLPAELS